MPSQGKAPAAPATSPGTSEQKGCARTISQPTAANLVAFLAQLDAALGVSTFDPNKLENDPGHLGDLEDLARCHALIAAAAQTPAINSTVVRLLAARLWSVSVMPLGDAPNIKGVALWLALSGRGTVATLLQPDNLIGLDTLFEALCISGRAHSCGIPLGGLVLSDDADRKIHLIGTAALQQEVGHAS
jgi:hypothetical protein